jgi:hypothetical protein
MSRSGTTLLSTILDSHSQVSMGYELIPPKLPSPSHLSVCLEKGLALAGNDLAKCGRSLRKTSFSKEGLFFTRCYRAGLEADDLKAILQQMQTGQSTPISTLKQRLEVAWTIANHSAKKRNCLIYGFKLNIPSVDIAYKYFPNSRLLYILRDPRDVVASHIQSNFDRTLSHICDAWNNYIQSFNRLIKDNPDIGMVVRYEDIVSNSGHFLPILFEFIPLNLESSVFEFYNSKAGIHVYGHPNAENLKKDFFTTSIGRWKRELSSDQVAFVENQCMKNMELFDYALH